MGGKASLPSQKGKTFVVTGANSGIGFITAQELGKAEATVVVCARDQKKGDEAVEKLKKAVPQGQFETGLVDLSSLASVKAFAETFTSQNRPIDVLINNAGVMNIPKRELSADGFEMQLATNCLGHFALTLRLIPSLRLSKQPRVVNVSSIKAQGGIPREGEIEFVRDPATYSDEATYAESKMLNLLFNNELGRRCSDILCIGAHPGVCSTNLFRHKYGWATFMMQSPATGAQSPLKAALDPEVKTGDYFGPEGWYGGPKSLTQPQCCLNQDAAKRYWEAMEKATGVSLPATK